MINSRSKGSAGEREACRWLQEKLELDFLPTRTLDQTREGGADITCIKPFFFEVKRCQALALRDWWVQVTAACDRSGVRVVMFRQDKQPWRFLISATYIGLNKGFIQLEQKVAIEWMKKLCKKF